MDQDLDQMAYDIGKRFGNGKLSVNVDPYFTEVKNGSGTIRGRTVFSHLPDDHLHVYIQLPGDVSEREKEIRIANEFGEIAFKKNHQQSLKCCIS